jgi:molecular chaperone HtpG
VSRSYLQSDREVKKITQYITKKVADKLSELYRKDREAYNNKWKDISVFVKYGMLSDDKFDEKAREFVLLKNTEGALFTLDEYREKITPLQTDNKDKVVYIYSNNLAGHDAQIQAANARGYDVLEMDIVIDNHFMQHLEFKASGSDKKINFVRVDSETADNLVAKDHKTESVLNEEQQGTIKSIFDAFVGEENYHTTVVMSALTPDDAPVQITRNEFARRMNEMRQFSAMDFGGMPDTKTIVVNTNHPLVADKLLTINDSAKQSQFAHYLYDLARVGQGLLSGAELTAFVKRSLDFVK